MKMIRTFNSVGQGAFYTEEFYDRDNKTNFTMVYDCGSYGNEKLIINEIKHSGLKQDIDLLFISHFHADHINGLEHLLKNYNIERILLPFLYDEEKIEVFLANSDASDFIKNLSLYPKETIQKYSKNEEIQITFILPTEEENQNNESIDINHLSNNIPSGYPIELYNYYKWIYVPFNFRFTKRSNILKDELNKIGINRDNFDEEYEKNKDKIIKIYKNLKGDLNTNSLVIYSGQSIEYDYYNVKYSRRKYYRCDYSDDYIGCIYMGDYKAKEVQKWKEFEKAFQKYFEYVGIIQIPHHGSSHNYNQELHFKEDLLCVMSAGVKNSFGHPHGSTLKQIILNDGIPIIVTERASSQFIQKIEFHG